jgi:hypothetical protein
MKRILLAFLLFTVALPAVYAATTTNTSVTVYDEQGNAVLIPVPSSWGAFLERYSAWIAGVMIIAKFILRFLPAPQPGTVNAFFVWLMKHLALTTPEKHAADIPLQPTAVSPPGPIVPTTNFHG